jgi:hypothetical protein
VSGQTVDLKQTVVIVGKLGKQHTSRIGTLCSHTLTHSQALQPMQGLGRLKKSPPTISILGLALPISDSQPLCVPHHSIIIRHSTFQSSNTARFVSVSHIQGSFFLVFVTSNFYRGRSSARRPTPNLQDQSASLSLGHDLRPVRQGRPYR